VKVPPHDVLQQHTSYKQTQPSSGSYKNGGNGTLIRHTIQSRDSSSLHCYMVPRLACFFWGVD
jgi:hypothetical protein